MKIGKRIAPNSAISTANADTIVVRGADLCQDLIGQVNFGDYFYFLLTGKPIFDGDDNMEITNQVLHTLAPQVSASAGIELPEELDALIAACLEKERSRRPQSVDAVVEAIDRLSSRLAWTQIDAEKWWIAYRESLFASPCINV